MEQQEVDIELREHEIENILGRTPSGLLRIGIMIIFVVFVMLLVGSSFFSYPDMITARVVVTSENAPFPLVGGNGGKIGDLLVEDNQQVKIGTIVCVMENAAQTSDMLGLKDFLEGKYTDSVGIFDRDLQLGEVYNTYIAWKYDVVSYINFKKLRYHLRSIEVLSQQIEYLRQYIKYNEQQQTLLNEQLVLERKSYNTDQYLAERHIIAETDLDKSRKELLRQQSGVEANKAAMTDSRIRLAQLKQNILEVRLDYEKQQRTFEEQIRKSKEILLAQIKQWEQMYVIKAPADGRLVYTRYWMSGEFVTPGETMFMLLQEKNEGFVGRIELPMIKSGKVEPGQDVHIKLDNYPYLEYGILVGKVGHVSAVANKDIYRVDVVLANGLKTSYYRELTFLQGMSGMADIITEKQTLLQHLLFPLKSLMNKRNQ